MKTRIAKKILNLNGRHWYRFYREHSGYDLAPLNANRYYKANKVLHKTPYYYLPWLNLIYELYGKPKKLRNCKEYTFSKVLTGKRFSWYICNKHK